MVKIVRLKAATLIESIVASVIFMIVFAATMITITRLTVSDNDSYTLVDADFRIKECFREFGNGEHNPGVHKKKYHWGEVVVTIVRYRDYTDLQEITVVAKIRNNRKQIVYKHVIEVKR